MIHLHLQQIHLTPQYAMRSSTRRHSRSVIVFISNIASPLKLRLLSRRNTSALGLPSGPQPVRPRHRQHRWGHHNQPRGLVGAVQCRHSGSGSGSCRCLQPLITLHPTTTSPTRGICTAILRFPRRKLAR